MQSSPIADPSVLPHLPIHPSLFRSAAALIALAVALFTAAIYWNPVGARARRPRHGRRTPLPVGADHQTLRHHVVRRAEAVRRGLGLQLRAESTATSASIYEMSRLLENDKIDDETLAKCDVLVIKTPTQRYSPAEVDAVVRFVERGGGLLLIGDHTNF